MQRHFLVHTHWQPTFHTVLAVRPSVLRDVTSVAAEFMVVSSCRSAFSIATQCIAPTASKEIPRGARVLLKMYARCNYTSILGRTFQLNPLAPYQVLDCFKLFLKAEHDRPSVFGQN
jgi:hypothetical protein